MTKATRLETMMTHRETDPATAPAERAAAPAAAAYPPIPRDANGRFLPGAPGRRLGQRNLTSARVARAILKDFEAHQDELLPRMRRWFLPQYLQLIGRMLPKNGTDGGIDDAELAAALEEALAEAEAAGEA